jgi:hypothetical protein
LDTDGELIFASGQFDQFEEAVEVCVLAEEPDPKLAEEPDAWLAEELVAEERDALLLLQGHKASGSSATSSSANKSTSPRIPMPRLPRCTPRRMSRLEWRTSTFFSLL